MAAVSASHMLMASSRIPSRSDVNRLFNARSSVLGSSRTSFGLRLRCMAENSEPEKTAPAASQSTPSPLIEPTPLPPKPKVSTKFSDLFAFSGPAPERINGRLAMIGFVTAIAVELSKGQDLSAQLTQGGVTWFIGTSLLLSAASLIPLFKGVRAEAETNGIMNANAELWNGRFAMLGLVALAFTEYVTGSALVINAPNIVVEAKISVA